MPVHICKTCGTSYPDMLQPPGRCPICEDERQFVPRTGQAWITRERLAATHANAWRRLEADLFEIHTQPEFAIGQRALLLRTPQGNILWDCIALFDDATEALLRSLGGIKAIAISHPHYYTCMQDWAHAFECPIHLHAADAEWVMRGDGAIHHWQGETLEIWPALLVSGGSFAVFQFVFATIHVYLPGVVLFPMTDIGGGIFSLIVTAIFLAFWKPRREWQGKWCSPRTHRCRPAFPDAQRLLPLSDRRAARRSRHLPRCRATARRRPR